MTRSMFGEKVRDFSITGTKSVRTGRTQEALPASEFMALRDIFNYYLTSYKGWANDADLQEELEALDDHLRLALSDLSKQPKPEHAHKKPPKTCKNNPKRVDEKKKPSTKKQQTKTSTKPHCTIREKTCIKDTNLPEPPPRSESIPVAHCTYSVEDARKKTSPQKSPQLSSSSGSSSSDEESDEECNTSPDE